MVLIGWPVVDAVWGFLRSPEFSAIGSIATLGGLWLAWKAIVDGKALSKNLRDVEKSLSTRRVGEAPDLAGVIAELVVKAKVSIQITAIFPVVAIYRNPQAWVALENALRERQTHGVKVELLYSSREQRWSAMQLQYADAFKDWAKWSANPVNAARLEAFTKRYECKHYPFQKAEQFLEFILEVQADIVSHLYWTAPPKITDDFVPVITWIIDGGTPEAEAFFAVTLSEGKTIGFVTRDQHLIGSFQSVRDLYSLAASPGSL